MHRSDECCEEVMTGNTNISRAYYVPILLQKNAKLKVETVVSDILRFEHPQKNKSE